MVLTEEQQTDVYPTVTFEDAAVGNEQIYYDSVDQERVARPGSFFTSGTNGSKVQLLRKSTQPIGAGKLLKVMAGDRLHVKVDYYTPNDATDNSSANGLNSVIAALTSMLNALSAPPALKGSGGVITDLLDDPGAFVNFMAPQGSGAGSSMPKAYLNILFFDEQFKFVQESSEIVQITTKGSGQQIFRVSGNAKVAGKYGYVYIYLSNESNNFVYFDNFQVSHERGPVLEETHYYPFGVAMAGISSKALKPNYAENKYKFNGIELNNDCDINQYDAHYRNLDPQIGRWWQIDPKPNEAFSAYAFGENNPISKFDPLGDTVRIQALTNTIGEEAIKENAQNLSSFQNGLSNFFGGKVGVQINSENGDLTLSINDGETLNEQQQNAFDFLQNKINSTEVTNYGVSSGEGDGKFFKTDVMRDDKKFDAILNVGLISQLGDGNKHKELSSSNILFLGLTKGNREEFKKGTGVDIRSFNQGIPNTIWRKKGYAFNTRVVLNNNVGKPARVNFYILQKIDLVEYDVNYKGEVLWRAHKVNMIKGYSKGMPPY